MSKVKDLLNDQAVAAKKDVKETLGLLYELAQNKSEIFGKEIEKDLRTAGTNENRTVPVVYTVNTFEEIRVATASSLEKITTSIKDSIKDILAGSSDKIVDGITNLVQTVVTALLGVSEGQENYKKCYYIATDGLSLVRLDMYFWSRSISVDTIKSYAEKSLVCTIYKSTIDVSKINFNTFLSIYQEQLNRMDFKSEGLKQEIEHAKEIFKLMCSDNMQLSHTSEKEEVEYMIGELSSITNQVKGTWPPIASKK